MNCEINLHNGALASLEQNLELGSANRKKGDWGEPEQAPH